MNKNELKNILLNLYQSDENVILLNGKWGSGKTYLINEFINEFNKLPVYYVSMLGKRNVDELNTSLYLEVTEYKENIKEIVPSVINPIKSKFKEHTSLDFILKKDNNAHAIIIFDDFERYGSSNYDEFLSYVSSLILSKAKIIVVSNLDELGGGERLIFNDYKEKIFDHVYQAQLFSNNVFEYKFKEFSKYLSENSINVLKTNIRLVDKTYNFLSSLSLNTKFNNLKDEYKVEFVTLTSIFISIIYNQNKLNYYDASLLRATKQIKDKYKTILNDENNLYDALHVYEYILNKYQFNNLNNIEDIVLYLYLAYLYADYSYINLLILNIVDKY